MTSVIPVLISRHQDTIAVAEARYFPNRQTGFTFLLSRRRVKPRDRNDIAPKYPLIVDLPLFFSHRRREGGGRGEEDSEAPGRRDRASSRRIPIELFNALSHNEARATGRTPGYTDIKNK